MNDEEDKKSKLRLPIAPAGPLHSCPYLSDIYGDDETLCDCDDDAIAQCAGDI